MNKSPITFYLAGRYCDREKFLELSKELQALEGGMFKCATRWLDSPKADDSVDAAYMDLEDIRQASVFIVADHGHARGGKWIELGYAMALNKKTVFLHRWPAGTPTGQDHPLFINMPEIGWVTNIGEDMGVFATRLGLHISNLMRF